MSSAFPRRDHNTDCSVRLSVLHLPLTQEWKRSGLPLSRQKKIPSLLQTNLWNWTDTQNLSTQILKLYIFFQYTALKLFRSWNQPIVHKQNGYIRYATNSQLEAKFMLWYQSVLQAHYTRYDKFSLTTQIFQTEKFPRIFHFLDHFRIPQVFQKKW